MLKIQDYEERNIIITFLKAIHCNVTIMRSAFEKKNVIFFDPRADPITYLYN